MGLRTLYIGETNVKDTKYYYELDESACNLYIGNYKTALEEKSTGVFYTSLPDFGERIDMLMEICLQFDEIIYRPPAVWTKDSVRYVTEEFVEFIKLYIKIDFAKPIIRKTKEPQMWVSGCSWSDAFGVSDDKRWATLLANKLNMPYTVLAESGSGNTHQTRKLLSADIRENDVVIFQVTTPHRETIIHSKYGQLHVNAMQYDYVPDLHKTYSPDRLVEMTLLFNQMRDIQNVVNFLQKTKARFMFWAPGSVLPMEAALESFMLSKDYFYLYPGGSIVDFGTDGVHPGPETHKKYADFVFEKLKHQEEQI
jgi:hypothetical protein